MVWSSSLPPRRKSGFHIYGRHSTAPQRRSRLAPIENYVCAHHGGAARQLGWARLCGLGLLGCRHGQGSGGWVLVLGSEGVDGGDVSGSAQISVLRKRALIVAAGLGS